jgi:4-amino-4-deoxy-L-arabinose transferase-like glycosyltransferase
MLHSQSRNLIRWYFSLALIEGLAALLWLLLLPGEVKLGGVFSLSLGRLALMAPLAVAVLVFGWAVFTMWQKPTQSATWTGLISQTAAKTHIYWISITLAALIGMATLVMLAIGQRITDPFIRAYILRLAPYICWVLLLSLQTLFFLRALRYGWNLAVFLPYRKALLTSLLVILLLLLLLANLLWTGSGFKPDSTGWGAPGVPLLAFQICLALAISLAGLALGYLALHLIRGQRQELPFHLPAWTLDATICLLLWLIAIWRWGAEPLKTSYFAPEPTPPNEEYYPYSDAAAYDLSAQKLLIGIGFEQGVLRPAYSAYLALAQGISGIGMDSVIAWQVSLLALIPLLLYLLAATLHQRLAGLLLGLLAIFHEANSLALTGIIDVSNAKMVMSDMPITLFVILFSLLVILWLQKPGEKRVYPLLAGGVLAIAMLIRIQVASLLAAFILCSLLVLRRHMGRWLKNSLILLTGLFLTLSPWLWRNWQQTGENLIADSQPTGAIFRFSSFGLEDSARLPGETDEEFLTRMRANAFSDVLSHPMATVGIIASHFWHNQISTLLVLPASFLVQPANELSAANLSRMKSLWNNLWQQCCSIQTYVHELPYWRGWNGHLEQTSWLPLLTSLLFISIGIGISWNRWQFTGLFPLFVTVSYSLSNTLGRISGWRYNLPVDWIGLLYYAIGLIQVCYWIATFFADHFIPQAWEMGVDASHNVDQLEKPFPWKKGAGIATAMILLVACIPLTEQLIPARYLKGRLQTNLNALSGTIDQGTLQRFLSEENAVALEGRAMYPRFYKAGLGIPKRSWPSFFTRDYPRLGFLLVGDETNAVILPLEKSPGRFPNAADVLVLGCKREDNIEARLVVILGDLKTTITTSPPQSWTCTSP